jgi:hypothetical protein
LGRGGWPLNYLDQEVAIDTESSFGAEMPLAISDPLLRRLEDTARPCVRMAVEGASSSVGATPLWLERASDIRTLGFSQRGRQSVLHIRAPRLGEAIPEMFDQPRFWPEMARPDETAIQLMGRIGKIVMKHEVASDMYDQTLLKHFSHWHSLFKREVKRIHLPGSVEDHEAATGLDVTVAQNAKLLSDQMPSPRQVRIVGKLDMVRHSTRSFALLLADGQEIRGVLEARDPELLQKHFGREITVFGKAIYRPSGSLLRLDAEEILDTTDGRVAFSSIPEALSKPFRAERKLQTDKTGVAAFFGTWPGEETDGDLLTALRQLRQ